jgi:hypothetical protein
MCVWVCVRVVALVIVLIVIVYVLRDGSFLRIVISVVDVVVVVVGIRRKVWTEVFCGHDRERSLLADFKICPTDVAKRSDQSYSGRHLFGLERLDRLFV